MNRPVIHQYETRCIVIAMVIMSMTHLGLLTWVAWGASPVSVEIASLAAGLRTLRSGEFSLFRVNPPFVRCWSAAPVACLNPQLPDWTPQDGYLHRPEFAYGVEFVKANKDRRMLFFRIARLSCFPFSVVAMIVCFLWAAERAGQSAGLLSAWIWCFSPSILGHGALLTNDVPAASAAVVSCFLFDRWLRNGRSMTALATAFALGIALLVKLTLVLLPVIWIVEMLLIRWLSPYQSGTNNCFVRSSAATWRMLMLIIVLGISILNMGYAGNGIGRRLGSFEFTSHLLSGEEASEKHRSGIGNKFRGTALENLPALIPADYLIGLDRQRRDLESGRACYVAGLWRHPPMFEFYLYAFMVKLPCGTLLLAVVSGASSMAFNWRLIFAREIAERIVVLCPIITPPALMFALLSSQNSAGGHFRYSIVCLPFFFVLVGMATYRWLLRHRFGVIFTAAMCVVIAAESFFCMPYPLGFFNFACGGPMSAHMHLLGTNADWGQDLDRLSAWWRSVHRGVSASPRLYVACSGELPLEVFFGETAVNGPRCNVVDISGSPFEIEAVASARKLSELPPGLYAISLNLLHDQFGKYRVFRDAAVSKVIGTSILVFQVDSKYSGNLGLKGSQIHAVSGTCPRG